MKSCVCFNFEFWKFPWIQVGLISDHAVLTVGSQYIPALIARMTQGIKAAVASSAVPHLVHRLKYLHKFTNDVRFESFRMRIWELAFRVLMLILQCICSCVFALWALFTSTSESQSLPRQETPLANSENLSAAPMLRTDPLGRLCQKRSHISDIWHPGSAKRATLNGVMCIYETSGCGCFYHRGKRWDIRIVYQTFHLVGERSHTKYAAGLSCVAV